MDQINFPMGNNFPEFETDFLIEEAFYDHLPIRTNRRSTKSNNPAF
jgi:hypothetical protein